MRKEALVSSSKLRMVLGVSALMVVLALAPAASAQSSSVDTYGGNGGAVAGVSSGGGPGSGTGSSSSGSLPFTGLDVGLIAGGGLVLLLMGIGMARITARPTRT